VFSPDQKNGTFRRKLKLSFRPSDYSDKKYRPAFQHTPRVSMDASFGNLADDSDAFFPRINTKDPYKRIGVSREASEEEIQAARNFLIKKYSGHQPSIDAIESAHDKIIMQNFVKGKNQRSTLIKMLRKLHSHLFLKRLLPDLKLHQISTF